MCRPAYMSFPATLVAATAFLAVPANADPKLVNPEKYNIELFADLSSQEGAPKAFQLTIADGKRSLPAGLYVTTGPLSGTHSDRIFQIEAPDKINVFASGLESSETMLVAEGKYGEGVLVSSPLLQQIMRVQPASGRFETAKFGTNKVSIFGNRNTSFGTKPFGVAVLSYGPEGDLYASDWAGGRILKIDQDGNAEVFATLPANKAGDMVAKQVMSARGVHNADGFIVSTFTIPDRDMHGLDTVYLMSADGREFTPLVEGLTGIQLPAYGPGGEFGSGLYIPTIGSSNAADGTVYYLTEGRDLQPFLEGIDAVHVAFDTENLLGGGMFVSDFNNDPDNPVTMAGKIWRITLK